MKYFLIAGEPSGDLHGSGLISALKDLDPDAQFRGMGGDMMIKAGLHADAHIAEFSIMGFVEVLGNIFRLRRLMNDLIQAVDDFQPDRIILIDYGGFNLRFAKRMHQKSRQVDYYILPKVWAWNEKRVRKIKRYVHKGYVIFPFEEDYFRQHGVDATYVGNPVVAQNEAVGKANGPVDMNEHQIVLLPGSRRQEIKRILPVLLELPHSFKNYTFKLALREASDLVPSDLPSNVEVVYGHTHQVIRESVCAIATSGTVNLETALWNVPQIVVYKANALSYWIGRMVVKIKYISPVNLILNRGLIAERIQSSCNAITLKHDLEQLLDPQIRQEIQHGYRELKSTLTNRNASIFTAKQILEHKE